MKNIIVKLGCEFVNLTNAITWRFWEHEDGTTILTVEWEHSEKDFAVPDMSYGQATTAMRRGLDTGAAFDLNNMRRAHD